MKLILKEICSEKKVTSAFLAEKTGISQRTIEEYRNRRREPSLSNGIKIASALGIEPSELLSE